MKKTNTSSLNTTFKSVLSCKRINRWSVKSNTFGFALILSASAIITSPNTVQAEFRIDSQTRLDQSLRSDALGWNIAGPNNNPNIISDFNSRDLWSYQIKLASETLINDRFYLQGSFAYSYIFSGEAQESIYTLDNRQGESSRTLSDADGSDLLDFDYSFGFTFEFKDSTVDRSLLVIPQIGYSVHLQNLKTTNGVQAVPATGPFPGQNQTYDASWYGPWIGIDMRFESTSTSALLMSFQYHEVDYYAEANWNLNTNLAHPTSFEHGAEGSGVLFSIGWREEFSRNWVFGMSVSHQDWSAKNGINVNYPSTGGTNSVVLNKVSWRSTAITLSVGMFFLGQ